MPEEILTNTCVTCKGIKPQATGFHKSKQNISGYTGNCKSCLKIKQREYRSKSDIKEKVRGYLRKYTQSQKFKDCKKRYQGTDKYRHWKKRFEKTETRKKIAKRYHQSPKGKEQRHQQYLKHKLRVYARSAIAYALRDGIITRPDECAKCVSECKPEAHHYLGYSKEHHFSIQWLCKSCHSEIHKSQRS